MAEIVQAINDASALGIPAPWPESFEDQVFVGAFLNVCIERSSETVWLETSGPEMDAIEEICRAEGISYEEFVRRAIDAFLAKQDGEATEDDEPEDNNDSSDW